MPCEYCPGRVREVISAREPISHPRGIVVLENAPIGVYDRCGAHYYAAPLLKRVEAILKSPQPPGRTMLVPVEAY